MNKSHDSDSGTSEWVVDPERLKGHILVVDDEPSYREATRAVLEARGHKVSDAENAESAGTIIAESQPDVILLDMGMPGKDGADVCHELKAAPETAHIPVLMISAMRDRKDRLRAIKAGANDFITKPVDIEEVVLRVRNALYTKRLYDELQSKYKDLREMTALGHAITRMLKDDNQAFDNLLNSIKTARPAAASTAPTQPPPEATHAEH